MDTINYGVILEPPRPDQWIFGGYTGLIENINLATLNWIPFYSRGVLQIGKYFDTMACVSFSGVRICEAIFNYQIAHGMISAKNIQWLKDKGYFDADGKVNFSERYIAKLSGTTRKGNSGYNVAEAIKNYGLIPNSLWPFPTDQYQPVFDWDDYYSDIAQNLFDLGQEFKTRFGFNYEVFSINTESLKDALRHSPVQVYGHAWNKPINGVYKRTDDPINHAFGNACPEWYGQDQYLDTDNDFIKQLAPDFKFYPWGYKYLFTEIKEQPAPVFKHNFTVNLRFGLRGDEVKYLQKALSIDGEMDKKYITGYFGMITLRAVIAFQKKYKITPAIGFCYAKTRAKLNQLFNK